MYTYFQTVRKYYNLNLATHISNDFDFSHIIIKKWCVFVRVWFCICPPTTTHISSDCNFLHRIIYEYVVCVIVRVWFAVITV